MRIIRIKTARQAEYGDKHVTVEWIDGTTTEEAVPGTVPKNQFAAWLEKKRGRKHKGWRHQ